MNYIIAKNLQALFVENIPIIKQMSLIKNSLDIAFVFGATSDTSTRAYFNKFVENQTTKLSYIMVENLTKDLKEYTLARGISKSKVDLIQLEHEAMHYAYAILIFPESPGSFAELGYFANDKDLCKKIVTIKNYSYFDDKTYLNDLIEFIHKDREISEYIMRFIESGKEEDIIMENNSHKFPKIINDIEDAYLEEQEKHEFSYSQIKKSSTYVFSISLLCESIYLFQYLTYSEIEVIYKEMLKYFDLDFNENTFKIQLSLLVVAKHIKRTLTEGVIVFSVVNAPKFIKYTCEKEIIIGSALKNDVVIDNYRRTK